ncbi:VWFA superfamily protein [Syntrophotalea carbinolica DSM 2380]|uniref:VWFA superfamily protein n=1 Tax=Syntrophotalea carbinolica (strain DSM 2380 / NBRC 103641 / GraBd1) TaxID=338963 RepID=Q3A7E6_SYNC1|nr:hypothetical protein [Syntrophotalea carbinolica]ABA87698.1 VWFA superfamily protein [Syntrophotalea carbinolica DSM 2380]
MFRPFFYALRDRGIMVSPTAFLRLQRALAMGLVQSLDDLYTVARTVLVKSERDFDAYDQLFAEHFAEAVHSAEDSVDLDQELRDQIEKWLKKPKKPDASVEPGAEQSERLSPEELEQYFSDRLNDQKEEHHGGRKWIGTGGVSPVGHSGQRPGGMRIGGISRNRSAMQVALERRYRDYSRGATLTRGQVGEALKRLRHLMPSGPRDDLNIDSTIYQTMRNGGEIELVFDRRLADRLKVILLIDNGGWSMEAHVPTVQALFNHARDQFQNLDIHYFHNTIHERVWNDPERVHHPIPFTQLLARDPQSRLIIVGDASMAPEELLHAGPSFTLRRVSSQAGIERLQALARAYRHTVWLNPLSPSLWPYGQTINMINKIFPMFSLSLDGLEQAVHHLMHS